MSWTTKLIKGSRRRVTAMTLKWSSSVRVASIFSTVDLAISSLTPFMLPLRSSNINTSFGKAEFSTYLTPHIRNCIDDLSVNCVRQGSALLYTSNYSSNLKTSNPFLPRCIECRRGKDGRAMRIMSVRLSVRPSVCQTREL